MSELIRWEHSTLNSKTQGRQRPRAWWHREIWRYSCSRSQAMAFLNFARHIISCKPRSSEQSERKTRCPTLTCVLERTAWNCERRPWVFFKASAKSSNQERDVRRNHRVVVTTGYRTFRCCCSVWKPWSYSRGSGHSDNFFKLTPWIGRSCLREEQSQDDFLCWAD